ncbi:MAG: RHS repeat-associated core domain-containing protein [Ruminococcus sp.]
MYESRPGVELYYFYDSYGNLTSIRYIKAGETTAYSYYVTTNAQGDVLGIYTAAGVQVAAYEYDAWGNCTVYDVTQNSNGNNVFTKVTYSDSRKFDLEFLNPFRYRGYYYDQDMGLYYLQSRYYDPQIGRFINADGVVSGTGSSVQGYNVFAYCFNNPVNMDDADGAWPKLVKKLVSRVKHTVKTMVRIASSPFKATTAKIGAGIGIGGKVKANIKRVPVEVGAVASISDSVVYQQGKWDARNSTTASVGLNVADIYSFSHAIGREHSYYDEKCTCDFMRSSFYDKSNCVANTTIMSGDATVDLSVSAYFLFGFEASISIDLASWNEELVSIVEESLAYKD